MVHQGALIHDTRDANKVGNKRYLYNYPPVWYAYYRSLECVSESTPLSKPNPDPNEDNWSIYIKVEILKLRESVAEWL